MAAQFTLYKVTGGREDYYAAVDWATGHVWTSPTQDGASRQARDAGLDTFIEQVISRDELLRKLGVGDDHPHRLRIDPAPSSPANDRTARDKRRTGKSPTTWFVPGDGAIEPETSIPQRLPPAGKKPGKAPKGGKGKSPFSGSAPIGPPKLSGAAEGEDIFIADTGKHSELPKAPFSDETGEGKN